MNKIALSVDFTTKTIYSVICQGKKINSGIHMLRHYDEIGLLIPEHVDDFMGYVTAC